MGQIIKIYDKPFIYICVLNMFNKQADLGSAQESVNTKIKSIEQQIFDFVGLNNNYVVHEVLINEKQSAKTIYIQSKFDTDRVFYICHGFGGSSLMFFPIIPLLLNKGSVVLWEIRGMGLTDKVSYPDLNEQQVQHFYDQGLMCILKYFNHTKIVFIGHSFGAYITLRFALKNSKLFNIEKCILLSAVGITSKHNDYKFRIAGLSDIYHYVKSWLSWNFKITYNTFLKMVPEFLKNKSLSSTFSKFQLDEKQHRLIVQLFSTLASMPQGSEKYFFQTFLPRVLPKPKASIQQIMEQSHMEFETIFYYGGKSDWVDKQGAHKLDSKLSKVTVKIIEQCTHMLPLHIEIMKRIVSQQLSTLSNKELLTK